MIEPKLWLCGIFGFHVKQKHYKLCFTDDFHSVSNDCQTNFSGMWTNTFVGDSCGIWNDFDWVGNFLLQMILPQRRMENPHPVLTPRIPWTKHSVSPLRLPTFPFSFASWPDCHALHKPLFIYHRSYSVSPLRLPPFPFSFVSWRWVMLCISPFSSTTKDVRPHRSSSSQIQWACKKKVEWEAKTCMCQH